MSPKDMDENLYSVGHCTFSEDLFTGNTMELKMIIKKFSRESVGHNENLNFIHWRFSEDLFTGDSLEI